MSVTPHPRFLKSQIDRLISVVPIYSTATSMA